MARQAQSPAGGQTHNGGAVPEFLRLVIADEAGPTAGFSAEIAAVATEDAATFARLEAPVKRVCALQVPIPYSPVLENHVFPDRKRIIAGVREVLQGRRSAEAT